MKGGEGLTFYIPFRKENEWAITIDLETLTVHAERDPSSVRRPVRLPASDTIEGETSLLSTVCVHHIDL